jgi:hypothetical protein
MIIYRTNTKITYRKGAIFHLKTCCLNTCRRRSEVPVITKESNDLCCKMWNKIINMEVITDDGDNISGENAFYNEFYLILTLWTITVLTRSC